MKLDPTSIFSPNHAQCISSDPVLRFVSTHQDGIWHAVRLLGGCESARLVEQCVEHLGQDRRLTPRTRIMLGQILSVLSLEKVDNPDLPYMGFFAVIDPSDPVVEEICLLTDGLGTAIAEYDALRQRADRDADAVRAVA